MSAVSLFRRAWLCCGETVRFNPRVGWTFLYGDVEVMGNVDIKNAFDNLEWPLIHRRLSNAGLPTYLARMVRSF